MRRVIVIAMSALAFLVTLPTPAHAWWEWLDEYTGRGPFTGPTPIEFRLLCVNDPLPEREPNTLKGQELLAQLKMARATFDKTFAEVVGGGVRGLHFESATPHDFDSAKTRELKAFLIHKIPGKEIDQMPGKEDDKLQTAIREEITKLRPQQGEGEVSAEAAARQLATDGNALAQAVKAFQEEVERIRRSSNPGDYVLRSLESFGSKNDHSGWARAGATVAHVGCIINGKSNPIASLTIRTRYLWSRDNDRQPDGHLDYSGTAPSVRQWQNEVLFSMFADRTKSIELVTGVGVSHIYTPKGEFPAFNRFYWKPIELDFAPVPLVRSKAAEKNPSWNNALTRGWVLSGSIVYIPSGFTAADFGATGDYKVDRELVGMFGLTWDLSRF